MKAVILKASENNPEILPVIQANLAGRKIQPIIFDLHTLNILPCRSCGSCGIRTPGKCVQKDDAVIVLKAMAESEYWIYLDNITFGGYSFLLKKIIDRTMILGEPFYVNRKGHLLHPMRYGNKTLIVIGLAEKENTEEEADYRMLVARNGMNMQARHFVAFIHSIGETEQVSNVLNRSTGVAEWI